MPKDVQFEENRDRVQKCGSTTKMIVMPLLDVGLVLIQNMEKAMLYFTLAVISGLFISMSCLCGHWVALKLAPEEGQNFQHSTITRGQTRPYVDRIPVNNAKFELQDRERGKDCVKFKKVV